MTARLPSWLVDLTSILKENRSLSLKVHSHSLYKQPLIVLKKVLIFSKFVLHAYKTVLIGILFLYMYTTCAMETNTSVPSEVFSCCSTHTLHTHKTIIICDCSLGSQADQLNTHNKRRRQKLRKKTKRVSCWSHSFSFSFSFSLCLFTWRGGES